MVFLNNRNSHVILMLEKYTAVKIIYNPKYLNIFIKKMMKKTLLKK